MVGLEPEKYRDRKPDELSGGQRQRVGVIRALAADPPVILMDEPFSALDPISREKLQDDLITLQTQIKKTIVFVTHDIQEAMKLGDRICLLNHGRVEQIDTPQAFRDQPKNAFVEEFMGSHLDQNQETLQLKDLKITTPLTETETQHDYPIINSDVQLRSIYSKLAQHEAVIVNDTSTSTQSLLKREDVFKFLSQDDYNKEGKA